MAEERWVTGEIFHPFFNGVIKSTLGGDFHFFCLFSEIPGEVIQIDEHIFFNHQPGQSLKSIPETNIFAPED